MPDLKEQRDSTSSEEGVQSPAELGDADESPHARKSLLAKLDAHLLPMPCILYLLSFLDRSNVANARIEGLVTDVKMTGNQYLTGLTLYFIGYVLFEIPCNIILKKTTPKFWLPTLTIIWGIVATLTGVVQNLAGFFTARFFLGVTESGLFPGVVWYLSMWYRRRERQYRISLFFSAASLAGAFGGVLAWGIAHMKGVGGQNGWRWIFIIEGLATVVIAATAYLFITNWPHTARWLSDDEKSMVHTRLKRDSDATNDERFTWSNVLSTFSDPKCWLYCMAFHTTSLPLYTLSLFLPSIITDLGYKAAEAQLLTVPPYALATILTVITAMVSERHNLRAPYIICSSCVGIIGYIILLANRDLKHHPGVSYVGTFFAAAGIYPATGLSLSWPAANVSGQTKRAVSNAMQISVGNLGAVLGTQLYRTNTAPHYVLGHSFAMAYLAANIVVVSTLWVMLKRVNRKRDELEATAERKSVADWTASDFKGDVDIRWRFTY
ncbi:MAG: hypothetical protein Q9162_005958 [Coniocarpon cinnabarinum]